MSTSAAIKQQRYREKKKAKDELHESVFSKVSMPTELEKEFTEEQLQQEYEEYKKIYSDVGYKVELHASLDYDKLRPNLDVDNITVCHGINLNDIDLESAIRSKYCARCDLRYPRFEETCPLCSKKKKKPE